jgi:hypothetical protein
VYQVLQARLVQLVQTAQSPDQLVLQDQLVQQAHKDNPAEQVQLEQMVQLAHKDRQVQVQREPLVRQALQGYMLLAQL